MPREALFPDLSKKARARCRGVVNSGVKWGGRSASVTNRLTSSAFVGGADGIEYVCADLLQLISGCLQFGCIAAGNCPGCPPLANRRAIALLSHGRAPTPTISTPHCEAWVFSEADACARHPISRRRA